MCCIETVCSPTAAKTFFFCIYNLFKVFIYLTSWIFHFKKKLLCLVLFLLYYCLPNVHREGAPGQQAQVYKSYQHCEGGPPHSSCRRGGRAPFVYPSFLPLVTAHTEGFSPLCDGGFVSQGHECEGLKKETFSF